MKKLILLLLCGTLYAQAPGIPTGLGVSVIDGGINSTSVPGNEYCTPSGTWKGPSTDGPATLPRLCMYTAKADTPSPGKVWGPINASSLLTTYSQAACGDIILIMAGTSAGQTTLTRKNCDDQHWLTIESTGVTDPAFPAEGNRLTPCALGLASMPGRHPYPCPTPKVLTAQFVAPSSGSAQILPGADHIRYIGIDFTRTPAPGAQVYNVVDLSSKGVQTDHIIFDRSAFRGIENTFPATVQSQDTSTTRGLYLGQSNHIAVLDSWFDNFYDTSSMSANGNTDAQCIGGGFGGAQNSGWGVYKFVNNHCEASGEGILLGGAGGPKLSPVGCTIMVNCNLDVPADIEVRQNYFFKPPQWNGNTTQPAGKGWPVIKNGFEMKIGARALFEGNVIENTWYQAQVGWCWSIAPKNQSNGVNPGGVGTAQTALTNDFTYRNNYCYGAAYGIGLYQSMDGGCTSCQAQGANGISIHDNVIGDALSMGSLSSQSSGDAYSSTAAKDSTSQGLNQLNNVSIRHNTFVKAVRYGIGLGADGPGQMHNWTMQDNIFVNGNFGVGSNPSLAGCSTTNSFLQILNSCVTGWTVDHNALFGGPGTNWPPGNTFFPTSAGPQFVNYGTGDSSFNPGNYQLLSTSPLHNAASDGRDIGADIPALLKAIAGVRQ